MRRRRFLWQLPLWNAALLSLASCEHRQLCFDHSHWTDLTVRFDWSQAPAADPETVVLYLFPREGGEPRRYEISNPEGSVIRVPSGMFDAVAFSGSMETLVERGDSYAGFTLTTGMQPLLAPMMRQAPSDPPRLGSVEDEPVVGAPGLLWADTREKLYILPGISGQSLTLYPSAATYQCSVTLTNVSNINSSLEVSGTLSTLSGAFSPAAKTPAGDDVTVPFPVDAVDASTMTGELTVFGHCHAGKRRHILSIYTSDRHYYYFDVTSQIHDAPDPRHIHIVIDGITLPDPREAGMTPSVEDWEGDVDIKLDMQ